MSGIRYWSLSAIRVKPSTDEPSNHVPWRTEPSSWWIGIVTRLDDADDVGELELDEPDAVGLGGLDRIGRVGTCGDGQRSLLEW